MCCHAEGFGAQANGAYSHAEGYNTRAEGIYSHAEGLCTTTSGKASHVCGQYNAPNLGDLFQIGNGTGESNRSNAFTVDGDGNGRFAGEIHAKDVIGTNADTGEVENLSTTIMKANRASKVYIVASGYTNLWWWRKWSNGMAECWTYRRQSKVPIHSAWGSLYDCGDSNTCGNIAFPFNFVGQPVEIVSVSGTGGACMFSGIHRASETVSGTYYSVRGTQATVPEVMYSFYEFGRYE